MICVKIIGLTNFPEIKPGDDLCKIIISAADKNNVRLMDKDIIVIAQKIVSKAENRIVNLNDVKPSPKALELSRITGKDPRFVELVLRESRRVVKAVRGHLIVETRHGIICANAGIDRSNVAGRRDIVALLPEDPDKSAENIRKGIKRILGIDVAVVISDTYGRPLRMGHIDMAIGVSGIGVFKDYRGSRDMFGYTLRVKRIALADELASAAELVMGNGAERIPVVIIRGLNYDVLNDKASMLNMPEEKWLFK